MKNIFLLSLICLFNTVNAQRTISGQVFNKKTKETIAYPSLTLLAQQSAILAGEKGFFELKIKKEINENPLIDTLIVSVLGFETALLPLTDFKNKPLQIFLTPKVYHFSEVVITDKDWTTQKVGALKKKKSYTHRNCTRSNIQVGLFIPSPSASMSYINSVRFYISKRGVPQTPFRVRIYEFDTIEQRPNKDILTQNVIITPQKGNTWVNVDLSKYLIDVPSGGFVVAMEWLYVEGEDKYLSKKTKTGKFPCFGQTIAYTKEFSQQRTWTYFSQGDWYQFKKSTKKTWNVAIGAEISIKMPE